MTRQQWLYLLLGGSVLAYLATRGTTTPGGTSSDVTGFTADPLAYLSDAVSATVGDWRTTQQGPTWVPVLNAAEDAHGIPRDLFARLAYEESHFREDVIRGVKVSSAGALGIVQMMPQYFTSVRVPRPYTDADVSTQIDEGATQLASLYASTGDWGLALAAYNAGLGAVQKYGGIPPFQQTRDYVAQILADVPVPGATVA